VCLPYAHKKTAFEEFILGMIVTIQIFNITFALLREVTNIPYPIDFLLIMPSEVA